MRHHRMQNHHHEFRNRLEEGKNFHRMATPHLWLNPRQCEACWDCLEVCPEGVFGKVNFFFHKHAVIKNPEACTGCMKCVKACHYGALERIRKGESGS